jgi:hypothetical protein
MARDKLPVKTWKEEVAAAADVAKATEDSAASTGSWVSLKGGRISIDGAEATDNQIDVIVLYHVLENQYYESDYDPDVPASPICFAFGRVAPDMAPHADCPAPQHDGCKGCPNSEWGSARKGKGKACKEVRRLALITADEADDPTSDVRLLKIPVMSCKNWTGYVRHLADVLHLPPFAVLTRISLVPDPKSQFRVEFKYLVKVSEAHLPALLARKRSNEDNLMRPYEVVEAPVPAPKARKFSR